MVPIGWRGCAERLPLLAYGRSRSRFARTVRSIGHAAHWKSRCWAAAFSFHSVEAIALQFLVCKGELPAPLFGLVRVSLAPGRVLPGAELANSKEHLVPV